MKFTIELEDFYTDEDDSDSLEASLKKHIITDVTHKIQASIKDKVDKQITEKVGAIVEEKIIAAIDGKLSELIDTGMIRRNGKDISIVDFVKDEFQRTHGWSNPQSQIEKIAKRFGEELKLQYNNAFANKIVMNMKEQGLLKDEVVQILLGGK